jgi:hypothetical protein
MKTVHVSQIRNLEALADHPMWLGQRVPTFNSTSLRVVADEAVSLKQLHIRDSGFFGETLEHD